MRGNFYNFLFNLNYFTYVVLRMYNSFVSFLEIRNY